MNEGRATTSLLAATQTLNRTEVLTPPIKPLPPTENRGAGRPSDRKDEIKSPLAIEKMSSERVDAEIAAATAQIAILTDKMRVINPVADLVNYTQAFEDVKYQAELLQKLKSRQKEIQSSLVETAPITNRQIIHDEIYRILMGTIPPDIQNKGHHEIAKYMAAQAAFVLNKMIDAGKIATPDRGTDRSIRIPVKNNNSPDIASILPATPATTDTVPDVQSMAKDAQIRKKEVAAERQRLQGESRIDKLLRMVHRLQNIPKQPQGDAATNTQASLPHSSETPSLEINPMGEVNYKRRAAASRLEEDKIFNNQDYSFAIGELSGVITSQETNFYKFLSALTMKVSKGKESMSVNVDENTLTLMEKKKLDDAITTYNSNKNRDYIKEDILSLYKDISNSGRFKIAFQQMP